VPRLLKRGWRGTSRGLARSGRPPCEGRLLGPSRIRARWRSLARLSRIGRVTWTGRTATRARSIFQGSRAKVVFWPIAAPRSPGHLPAASRREASSKRTVGMPPW